jgi:pyrroloquinoline-quinone synthase
LAHVTTRADQERVLGILRFKLDILWSMLDAMTVAYGIGPNKAGQGAPMPNG